MVTKEDTVWGKASSTPSQVHTPVTHNSTERHTQMTVGLLASLQFKGEASPWQRPAYVVLLLLNRSLRSPYLRVRNWCQEDPSPFSCPCTWGQGTRLALDLHRASISSLIT